MPYTFSLEDEPSAGDVAAVNDGLSAYNAQFAPWDRAGRVVILLRDEAGVLAGGLLGHAFWGWLSVEILWLAEPARGQDYGSRMLALAEQDGIRRGCHHALVDTMSFQALPFYQKHAYTIWGQLDDFPLGHQRYFLKKALGAPE